MPSRERQLAENEVRFRALNEGLREGSTVWGAGDGRLELVCECGDVDCTLAIRMSAPEYEFVREDEAQFVVVRGHERAEIEDIVVERDLWVVVRKRGEAAEIAAENDPRAS